MFNLTSAGANPSRTGQSNLAGSPDTLFDDVSKSEVFSAYHAGRIFTPNIQHETLQNANGKNFYALGVAESEYHRPGDEILGQNIAGGRITIRPNEILFSSAFIAERDLLRDGNRLSSGYNKELGESLAEREDQDNAHMIVRAARSLPTVIGQPGGSQVINPLGATNATVLANMFLDATTDFTLRNISGGDTMGAVDPIRYAMLTQLTDLFNHDFGHAGNGSAVMRRIGYVGGVKVMESNHIPQGVRVNIPGEVSPYFGNYTNTLGMIWKKQAVARVSLKDMTFHSEPQKRRLGHLTFAYMDVGVGVTRPECAIELSI